MTEDNAKSVVVRLCSFELNSIFKNLIVVLIRGHFGYSFCAVRFVIYSFSSFIFVEIESRILI